MAKDKKSFLIYCDVLYSIDHLTNEEKGILFQHLLEYVNDKNPVLSDRVLLTAWKPIERQLKRDLIKYEKTRDRNRENANIRWNKKNATECDRIQPNAIDAVNDIDIDIDTTKVDKYFKEISKSPVYLDGLYSSFKLEKGSISQLATEFKNHLKLFPKNHTSFTDFKRHFSSWLRIKDNNKELAKYQFRTKGSL